MNNQNTNSTAAFGAIFIFSGIVSFIFNASIAIILIIIGCFFACKGIKRHSDTNVASDLYLQSVRKDQEHQEARSSPDLSPDHIGKDKRYYHYKDVQITVNWQFSGQYEKTCESAGIKRGDSVELVFDRFENDPDSVAIVWNGETIGHMLENRMRGMVKDWKAKKKPVFCAVSHIGGETKILFEFAFYGYVKK